MKIDGFYVAFKEIDLENQSPLEVLTTVYGIMDSVDPVTCAHNIKDGLGLYIRDCDSEWSPTEKDMFIDEVYGALKKNIDLETQTPFEVLTELYEVMDFMSPVEPISSVKEALEQYLLDNGWSPEHED